MAQSPVVEERRASLIEGWLNVWEVGRDIEPALFSDGKVPLPIWEPHLCVLNVESKRLSHYRTEKAADAAKDHPRTTGFSSEIIRIGCSKEDFDRFHKIRPVEQDMKTMLEHSPLAAMNDPSFTRCQTLDQRQTSTPVSSQKQPTVSERRNSISSEFSESVTKLPQSHSKIISFFSRKLKRTKSATKLDRGGKKTVGEQSSVSEQYSIDNDMDMASGTGTHASDNNRSPLKRTASLGRLSRRWFQRYQLGRRSSRSKPDSVCDNQSASSVRVSHSHECLLPNPPSGLHSIDLASDKVIIRPLHNSILGHGNCFQVSTSCGSKYYACRTDDDRQNWIRNFQASLDPHRDDVYRVHNSLSIWILEAKNLVAKKKYFCEIHCDKMQYARTSAKLMSEMLFWGEQFEFSNLPQIEVVSVNIYREADRKKKKDRSVPVGYINISVSDINGRHPSERWYQVLSATVGRSGRDSRSETPSVRIKARYQAVGILPQRLYDPLVDWLKREYSVLVEVLEPVISVKAKEEIAAVLVAVFHCFNMAQEFLTDILVAEINRLDNDTLALRGNSIATKAVEAYMKLVGQKYLLNTLHEAIQRLLEPSVECEVDPTKLATSADISSNQKELIERSKFVWSKIHSTSHLFPPELKSVFSAMRRRCDHQCSKAVCDQLVSSCVFLRFFCPAILSPSLFGLTQEFPSEKSARNATLVAKTIQGLANFTKFGGKEEWMTFMNDFVVTEFPRMRGFLEQISNEDLDSCVAKFKGFIDVGQQLAMLHTLLNESVASIGSGTSKNKLSELQEILQDLNESLQNPSSVAVPTLPSPMHRSSFRIQVQNSRALRNPTDTNAVSPGDGPADVDIALAPVIDAEESCTDPPNLIDSVDGRNRASQGVDKQTFVSKKSVNLNKTSPTLCESSPVGREFSHVDYSPSVNSMKMSPAARDPEVNRFNSTDAIVWTTSNTAVPPDSLLTAVETADENLSSRRPDEKQIERYWQQIVDAANMSTNNRINLITFSDSNLESQLDDDTLLVQLPASPETGSMLLAQKPLVFENPLFGCGLQPSAISQQTAAHLQSSAALGLGDDTSATNGGQSGQDHQSSNNKQSPPMTLRPVDALYETSQSSNNQRQYQAGQTHTKPLPANSGQSQTRQSVAGRTTGGPVPSMQSRASHTEQATVRNRQPVTPLTGQSLPQHVPRKSLAQSGLSQSYIGEYSSNANSRQRQIPSSSIYKCGIHRSVGSELNTVSQVADYRLSDITNKGPSSKPPVEYVERKLEVAARGGDWHAATRSLVRGQRSDVDAGAIGRRVNTDSDLVNSCRNAESAGSSESLDSILLNRKSFQNRQQRDVNQSTTHLSKFTTHLSYSTPRINCEPVPCAGAVNHQKVGVDHGKPPSDFGALKRLWQSIEIPTSKPINSSQVSFSSRTGRHTATVTKFINSGCKPSASVDEFSSHPKGFGLTRSCDNLQTYVIKPTTVDTFPAEHTPAECPQKEKSPDEFEIVRQQIASTQASVADAQHRLLHHLSADSENPVCASGDSNDGNFREIESYADSNSTENGTRANLSPTLVLPQQNIAANSHDRSPPGKDPSGRWVVWL